MNIAGKIWTTGDGLLTPQSGIGAFLSCLLEHTIGEVVEHRKLVGTRLRTALLPIGGMHRGALDIRGVRGVAVGKRVAPDRRAALLDEVLRVPVEFRKTPNVGRSLERAKIAAPAQCSCLGDAIGANFDRSGALPIRDELDLAIGHHRALMLRLTGRLRELVQTAGAGGKDLFAEG